MNQGIRDKIYPSKSHPPVTTSFKQTPSSSSYPLPILPSKD
jgi:hypothetical protein